MAALMLMVLLELLQHQLVEVVLTMLMDSRIMSMVMAPSMVILISKSPILMNLLFASMSTVSHNFLCDSDITTHAKVTACIIS